MYIYMPILPSRAHRARHCVAPVFFLSYCVVTTDVVVLRVACCMLYVRVRGFFFFFYSTININTIVHTRKHARAHSLWTHSSAGLRS